MSVRFTCTELADITRGQWLREPVAGEGIAGVQDDSRQIKGGELFVAIRGELTDGHRFATKAIRAGAAAICIDQEPSAETVQALAETGAACLRVADTLVAFQELARAHRRRLADLLVVGITGSCGKTSTKEMIAAVLARRWPGQVHKTAGNFNNHFGVPRTLLELRPEHRAAVVEMGSNHPGEIAALVRLAEPGIGVVSNIGSAHLEFFRDLAGVAQEKGDILVGTATSGICILPAEAAHADVLRRKAGSRRVLTFGNGEGADVRATYRGLIGDNYVVELAKGTEHATLRWRIGGAHQALNAAAAVTVGCAVGLPLAESAAALLACELPGMRMKLVEIDGVRWANDAYNANPTSMKAGLDWFGDLLAATPDAPHVLVLGDMLEIGDGAPAVHRELLTAVKERFPLARILPVGRLMSAAAATCGLVGVPDSAAAAALLHSWLVPGSLVFLKGSHSIALERCLPPGSAEH